MTVCGPMGTSPDVVAAPERARAFDEESEVARRLVETGELPATG